MPVIEPTSRPPLLRPGSDLDVAIVGAGAAGIAAARRCLEMGLSVGIFEARSRVGGRAVTASFGGHPVDLGAHWIHAGAVNPLVRIGQRRGEPVRRAPGRGEIVQNGRFGGRATRIAHGQAFERADLSIAAQARREDDRDLAAVLPPLGRWRESISSTLALVSGRPLDEVSVKDFPSEEFGNNYFVRGGYGAFIGRLAAGLPIALDCPVLAIDWTGSGVVLTMAQGEVRARTVVVTVPASVIAADAIRFTPSLPVELDEAFRGFLPGTYEHVILNWPNAPFQGADRLVRLVSPGASHGMMSRIDGAPFHYLELGHATVAARSGQGKAGLARLARSVLTAQFGARALSGVRVLAVTDWVGDPWSRCAWAVAGPGHAGARDLLSRPVGQRLWFAGEANVRAMWGTVGGAWEAGEHAADEIASELLAKAR